jgi:hypothetical protein
MLEIVVTRTTRLQVGTSSADFSAAACASGLKKRDIKEPLIWDT